MKQFHWFLCVRYLNNEKRESEIFFFNKIRQENDRFSTRFLSRISINFEATITFLEIWLVDTARLYGDSHWLLKMELRGSVIRGSYSPQVCDHLAFGD